MDRKYWVFFGTVLICLLIGITPAFAQDDFGELAASLEVLSPGVEVLRVNTTNWIAVQVEAIVGVGDLIRTDETGKARITFFADGVDTEIQSASELRIEKFEGNDTSFELSATVLIGQSIQRIERILDAESSYDIQTPGMELTIRGTEFAVRVEQGGRSSALIFEGVADAAADGSSAAVGAGYGVRSEVEGGLSDVVLASSFDELDSALDGCAATVRTEGDVRLNVRVGPDLAFPRVGTIDAAEIVKFMGVSEAGNWYRIDFRSSYGWILANDATLNSGCAGLRVFPDTRLEDPSRYDELGETINLEDLAIPTPPDPDEEQDAAD